MANYEVLVGNIGTVHSGTNPVEAKQVYGVYKKQSQEGYGRAAREDVCIFRDGELIVEYHAPKLFEIREGDGNEGCYRRGTIEAMDAYAALRKASRTGMITKPRDVRINSDIEGDNQFAVVCSYVSPIFGDVCRWVAEARLISNE